MSPAIPGGGPPSPGPRLPWNSMARSSDAMRDTVIRCPSRNAPLPRAACQRAPKAGALATPATTSPPASIASRVANTGMPRTKLRVPSMGSMMSRASVGPGASPSSSPSTPSSGWFWRTAVRAIASIVWSASVTGLRSGFSWTRSPALRNHRNASSSARSASSVRKRSQSAVDMKSEREWSGWASNPRPPGCKPGALPAELPPLIGYKDSKRTRAVLRGSRLLRSDDPRHSAAPVDHQDRQAEDVVAQFDLGEGRLRTQSRHVGDGVRLRGGVIHHVPEIPHRSRGNDAQGVRDAAIQEPGHQLRREHRLAPVAVLRAGTAAVLHRHLRARAVGLTSVAVKRRGRLRADEVRVRAARARHQTERLPDRTEAEDTTHLVPDDLVELTSREEARDIGRVEVHHADTRLKTRIADETRTGLAEGLPWTVDRIELDEDDDVVDGLVDHGRTRATRARRETGKLIRHIAVDEPLPLRRGTVERFPLGVGDRGEVADVDMIRSAHAGRGQGDRVPRDAATARRGGKRVHAELDGPAAYGGHTVAAGRRVRARNAPTAARHREGDRHVGDGEARRVPHHDRRRDVEGVPCEPRLSITRCLDELGRRLHGHSDLGAQPARRRDRVRAAVADRGHQADRGHSGHATVVRGPDHASMLNSVGPLVQHDGHNLPGRAERRETQRTGSNVEGRGHGNDRLRSLASGQSDGYKRDRGPEATRYRHRRYHSRPGA